MYITFISQSENNCKLVIFNQSMNQIAPVESSPKNILITYIFEKVEICTPSGC